MDPADALRIAEASGLEPAVATPLAGGQHGGWIVRTRGGERLVVKLRRDAGPPWAVHGPAMTAALADGGMPVPRQRRLGWIGEHHVEAWELLPGSAPAVLTPVALEAVMALHRAQTGLAAELRIGGPRAWRHRIRDELAPDGPWARQHTALREHGHAAQQLFATIQAQAPGRDLSSAREHDVVHGDLHHGNLLEDAAGALTGVIDWEQWSPGDCRADLVTLLFSARTVALDDAVGAVLSRGLRATVAPDLLWTYAARDVVRAVGWFACEHPNTDLEPWIAGCEALLAELR